MEAGKPALLGSLEMEEPMDEVQLGYAKPGKGAFSARVYPSLRQMNRESRYMPMV